MRALGVSDAVVVSSSRRRGRTALHEGHVRLSEERTVPRVRTTAEQRAPPRCPRRKGPDSWDRIHERRRLSTVSLPFTTGPLQGRNCSSLPLLSRPHRLRRSALRPPRRTTETNGDRPPRTRAYTPREDSRWRDLMRKCLEPSTFVSLDDKSVLDSIHKIYNRVLYQCRSETVINKNRTKRLFL